MSNTKPKNFFARLFSKKEKSAAPTVNIEHQQGDDGKGRFFVAQDGEELAMLEYSNVKNTVMTINHTDVSDKLRGMGIGKKLITTAVNFAREQNMKIVPMCPYAKSVFDKNVDLKDVLKGW